MPQEAKSRRAQTAEAARRTMLVSADCHGGGRAQDYREYMEPRYRGEFDEWAPRLRLRQADFLHPDYLREFNEAEAVAAGGEAGAWDFERRLSELEADGVVGDVIFPNPGNVPFGFGFGAADPFSPTEEFRLAGSDPQAVTALRHIEPPELRRAGARAYNRWLADRCSEHPGRHAGVMLAPIDDIAATVADIRAGYEAGARGGILLPDGRSDYPLYNHERYEPLWDICEGLDLPVHTHPGAGGTGKPVAGAGGGLIARYENALDRCRLPLVCMMFGGVFQRHPKLKFVVTEQGIEWIPAFIQGLDDLILGIRRREPPKFVQHLKFPDRPAVPSLGASLLPSAIWKRQCFAGASFAPRAEIDMRHQVGIDKVMWGSDYPHYEGTWPHTKERLHAAFEGLPKREVERMVGENALSCYTAAFRRETLVDAAQRVGPNPSEL